MSKIHETAAGSSCSTFDGISALIMHVRNAMDAGQLDPQFVDKLIKKIRQELDRPPFDTDDEPRLMATRIEIEDLSLSVIHAKAAGLSENLGRLREADLAG